MLRYYFDSLGSTNCVAAQIAARHPGRDILVSSLVQTAGRGRNGRTWQSPRGGAWFTLALPAGAAPETYEPLPVVVGYAVLGALRECLEATCPNAAADLRLKWPNDVLLGGRKVGGILCERVLNGVTPSPAVLPSVSPLVLSESGSASPERAQYDSLGPRPVSATCAETQALKGRCNESELCRPLRADITHDPVNPGRCPGLTYAAPLGPDPGPSVLLLGVGINVNLDPGALGPDLRVPATSLQAVTGRQVTIGRLIDRCAALVVDGKLALECAGFTAQQKQAIEAVLAWRGQDVVFRRGESIVRGRCVGLDSRGHLCLDVGGQPQRFSAGEIEHLGAASNPASASAFSVSSVVNNPD